MSAPACAAPPPVVAATAASPSPGDDTHGALLADAERATGFRAQSAVITVPAYFDEAQRTALLASLGEADASIAAARAAHRSACA